MTSQSMSVIPGFSEGWTDFAAFGYKCCLLIF